MCSKLPSQPLYLVLQRVVAGLTLILLDFDCFHSMGSICALEARSGREETGEN